MKSILKVILVVTALGLAFLIYRSVQGFVDFNKEKMNRYATAVEQLQDLALAEKLYKVANGEYTASLDTLKNYINTAKVLNISRKDSSAYVFDRSKGIDVMKNFTIVDTIVSSVSVKDSIFGNRDFNYKNFGYVPVNDKKFPIELYASFNDRVVGNDSTNIQRDHFFMGSIDKAKVLDGLDEEMVSREIKDDKSPIKSDIIKVGSKSRPSLEGNWGTDIDVKIQEKRIKRMKSELKK